MSDRRITALERAYEQLRRDYDALKAQVDDQERRLRNLEAPHRAELSTLEAITDTFTPEAPHG